MSFILGLVTSYYNWHNGVNKVKASLKLDNNALRIGVLSAAKINPIAIIDACQTCAGASLVGIAARDKSRAQAQVDKFNLGPSCKAYGSYADLIADPSIEAVYIPLPNGLHTEWAIKAMEAGKHVLIEKPIANNAAEVRKIAEVAKKTDKVALEAFHWRFHPAAHTVKELVESGKYGNLLSAEAFMRVPRGFIKPDDIRLQYALGGGAIMDLTYVFCSTTYFASPDMTKCNFQVKTANPRIAKKDAKVDEAMEGTFAISQAGKPDVNCTIHADLGVAPLFGLLPRIGVMTPVIELELEKAKIEFVNFALPMWGHSINITDKATGKKEVKKCNVGGPQWGDRGKEWYTTYRWQLEAFLGLVKEKEGKGEFTGPRMTLAESEKLMSLIDMVYDKAGLPRRGIE